MAFKPNALLLLALILSLQHIRCDDKQDRKKEGKEEKELKDRLGALEFQVGQLLGGNLAQARRSCSDWLRDGFTLNGHYLVDPDGLRGVSEFLVWCDMSKTPPVAVIHHDKEDRMRIDGFEGKGEYKMDIVYATSSQHISALMERSGPCRQRLRYECQGSIIYSETSRTDPYSWWEGNGKEIKTYWPGGNPHMGGCECYKTKSCAGGNKCNCNRNDPALREDSGDVTDKELLPITGLRIGDTGDRNEHSFVTLGPLLCEN
ncbi:neurexin-4 [Lingula anatina]|uniref:Neurexin-4 n=1 Tax=Lingula anatina TaxID=7574 RepID=A0A1S3K3F4_LINAN|nr:neurexin-4 [Lingula anatina]|eukprot:XP_013416949.1 neurexin-4 [Lingula anatina]